MLRRRRSSEWSPNDSSTGQSSLRRFWRFASVGLMTAGIASSVAGGWLWASYQQSQDRKSFDNVAEGIGTSIDTGLQRDLDFQRSFGNLIATTPNPSNRQIGAWLSSLDPSVNYPGTVGMTFIMPVRAGDLASYETAVTDDPIPGYGSGPYAPYPTGSRSIYCMARYGVVLHPTGGPPGYDACASEIPGIGKLNASSWLNQATASGTPQLFSMTSMVALGSTKSSLATSIVKMYRNVYLVLDPVFKGGVVPTSVSGRQASIIGWTFGDFDGPMLISRAMGTTKGLNVSLASGTTTVASLLSAPGHSLFVHRQLLAAAPGISVAVSGVRSSTPGLEGMVLAALGIALTLVLFALFYHLGRSREVALRMVDERTLELKHQASHDPLTGLANRAELFYRAEQILARAHRYPRVIGALFVDIDNFKEVNDTFGHDVGDSLLAAVANRLRASVRSTDTIGRLGGDEFLVLTEEDRKESLSAEEEGPEVVARRIIEALSEPIVLDPAEPVIVDVRVSVGVACGIRDTVQELVREADVALYQAKQAGKGCYVKAGSADSCQVGKYGPEMATAPEDDSPNDVVASGNQLT